MFYKIKTFFYLLILSGTLLHAWEVNTHRAIDRCALSAECGGQRSLNLQYFVNDTNLLDENYDKEIFENYTTENGETVTYFQYATSGETYGISKWNQQFTTYTYQDLIEAGTILEDALLPKINKHILGSKDPNGGLGRFGNHFYDSQDNGAGLSIVSGSANTDAITWATKDTRNVYGYANAIKYFKEGFSFSSEQARKSARAKLFVSLGFMLHVLNDMNVPAHTRDDSHPLGDPLEEWMRGGEHGQDDGGFKIYKNSLYLNDSKINNLVNNSPIFRYNSIQDFYKKEATFTGKHFYSEDSISVNGGTFGGYSNYLPNKDKVSTYTGDNIGYITSNEPELLSEHKKLAMMKKSKIWGKSYFYSMQYNGDTSVLEDNGVNLIPRAVANAEGFVNYFFRGRIKGELTPCGFKVTNISNTSLVANANVVTFKKGGSFKIYADDPNDPQADRVLLVEKTLDADLGVNSTIVIKGIADAYKEQKGELEANVPLTVVYDGDIGSETGVAVSSGVYDLSKLEDATAMAKHGAVEVYLNWKSADVDLDLELINWENVGEYDLQDTGCPSEHFVIENEVNVKAGHYFVNIKPKDTSKIDDNISEEVSVIIKALNKNDVYKFNITEGAKLDLGNVAEIIINKSDVSSKPSAKITPDPGFRQPIKGIVYHDYTPSASTPSPAHSCSETATQYDCGCRPCSAKIIPYLEQALAGPLSDADIELYIASEYKQNTPLYVSKTSTGESVTTAGIIDIPHDITTALNDNELYIIHARGGTDIDSNDDFVLDNLETLNRGSLHTVIDGKSLKRYGYKLNLLTEIAYQNVKDDIGVLSNQAVLDKLDEIATLLLNGKIDPSSSTSLAYNDLITWLPSFDKELLFYSYDSRFAPIASKIYKDENISQDAYDVVYGKSPTPRIKSDIFELNESAPGGTLVGEINILDEGQSPIESLTLLGNGSENFFLDSNNVLRVAPTAQLDFETTKAYYLKVLARNAQGESYANITIFIRDLLDAPVIAYVDINDTFSNAAPFSLVGQVEFNQGTSTITQMTLTGNGEKYFDIDPSGRITISSIGLESILESTTFSLTLKAKNDSGYSRGVTLPFHVIKVADGIPTLKNFSGSINENIAGGSLVGKVSFDIGASPINAFILAGAGSENFTIDLEGNIRVKDGAVLDYETTPYYKFSTSARNANGTSKSATVTITLNNLEDANENVPVLIDNKTFNVDEDVPSGTYIGNVLKSSGLSQVQSISCSDPKFHIDTNGSLYLNDDQQLDYETKTAHTIVAIATNDYGQSIYKVYTIAVNNVVDVPTLTPLVTNVPENSPQGTIVGTISFDEGTSPIETIAFTSSPEFSIDMQGVIRIKSGVTLDYEMKQSYALQAYATNASGRSPLVNVTINIGNQLDAPELRDISYTLEENSRSITLPTNLVVNEGLTPITSIKIFDSNGSQSSSLRADINGTIYITDVANLDYETSSIYTFYAKAYNNEGVSKAATIHLNLINVLDAPELNSFSGYIDENATIGTVVGQLTFNPGLSPVSSMVLYPSSSTPLDPIPCSIDENGTLRLITHLDYEKKTSYSFRAYAINDQGKSSPVSISISVNDVLDSPILHTLYTDVNESIHGGELIDTISYQEGLDAITSMSLSGADSEKFRVDVNGNIYLKANEKLNFEEKNSYNFYAQAFSPSYNSNIVDIHVTVNDIDEYGVAGIGRWSNADVKIYKVENNASKTLVYSDTTSVGNDIDAIGLFDSHKLDLNESAFYIYEVSGGEDYDTNNDGILDATPTTNKGTIHAIIKGSWVRDSDWRPKVNLLTEVYYQWAIEYIDDLEKFENRLIKPQESYLSLNNDLNGDSSYGNAIDALIYDPVNDLHVWNSNKFPERSLEDIQNRIYKNDPTSALYISNSFLEQSNIYISGENLVSKDQTNIYMLDRTLSVIDISYVYDFSPISVMQDYIQKMTISDDQKYLFFTTSKYESMFLKIFDISDISNPIEISSALDMPYTIKMKLSHDATKLFITFSNYSINSGFEVIDVSNKSNPVMGAQITTSGQAFDFVLSQDEQTLYLCDDRGGLKIIDISDPNNMKIVGEYIANGLVQSVQLSEDETKAFVSVAAPTSNIYVQKGHIQVIDITDKSNPHLFKDLDLNSSTITAFKFNANKTKLFVSHGYPEYNDKIYEIKGDFEEFKLLGETPHSYYTSSDKLILLENETIMLAVSSYKIDVIDISDPKNPIILNRVPLKPEPS